MKTFVCLLATFAVCNATILSFLGGGGGGGSDGSTKTTYNVIATPSNGGAHGSGYTYTHGGGGARGGAGSYGHGHRHGYSYSGGISGDSTQLIKVILENGNGYGNGGGSVGGQGYGHGYAMHSHGSHGEQVYKVIEHAAPVAPIAYLANGYGQSYTADHKYGGGDVSYNSQQLNSILPQIIQLVLQEDALYGGSGGYGNVDAINGQVIDAFGHRGKAIIMNADQAQGAFFKRGHVVQRGTLKVMRVQEQQQQQQQHHGAGGYASGGGGWSNGGASIGAGGGGGWSSAQTAGW